jgi:hypothetical protein
MGCIILPHYFLEQCENNQSINNQWEVNLKRKKIKLRSREKRRRATRALCSKNKKTICGGCSIQDSGGKIGNWEGRTDNNTATIKFKKEEERKKK